MTNNKNETNECYLVYVTSLTGSTVFIYYNTTNSTRYKVIFGTDIVYVKLHVE